MANQFADLIPDNPSPITGDQMPVDTAQMIEGREPGESRKPLTLFTARPADFAKAVVGVGETAINTVGNIATKAVAGIRGIGQLGGQDEQFFADLVPGAEPPKHFTPQNPTEVIEKTEAAGREVFKPRTEGGELAEKTLAGGIEKAGEAIKYPLSAVPLVLGGVEEKDKFMAMPMSDYLGELAQDNGASPLFATLAHLSPDLLLTAIGGGTAKAAARPGQVKPVVPTVKELKDQARALYKAVDDSGLRISDTAARNGVAEIERMMKSKGVRKKLNPDTAAALDELIADAKAGGITLSKSEELRQVINQAKGAVKPADAAAAQRLGDLWDDFIENKLKQSDIVGGTGDVKEVAQYLKSARGLWSRARKTDEIQELLRKAEINVQSQQGNIGLSQAIRTQFRQIAANQKRLKRFTPEERKFITRVATGDAIERAARTLGKIAPTQTIPILSEVAAVGAAALSGNPALLASAVALPVIGGLAKRISSSRTARFADEAGEVIRRGP